MSEQSERGLMFDEATARRLLAMLRSVERGGRPTSPSKSRNGEPVYQGLRYRVAANNGDGAYTVRLQRWGPDATPPVFVDIDDEDNPYFELDLDAYDARGHATRGVGDVVQGWPVWYDEDWYIVLDGGFRPQGPVEYQVLQAQGTGANAREVWDWVRMHNDPT